MAVGASGDTLSFYKLDAPVSSTGRAECSRRLAVSFARHYADSVRVDMCNRPRTQSSDSWGHAHLEKSS
jgi:hypothetical protein